MGLGQPNEAAAAYQLAVDSLRALDLPHVATEPLAGLARLALAQGNHANALEHVEQILTHLSGGGTLDGTNEPLRIFLTCYEVLHAAGDPRAVGVLETAYTMLQDQAAKITDDAMHRSFLENVPYHRAIEAAWAEVTHEDH